MIAILDAYRAGLLKKGHWRNNIISGIVVGVIALPLAMAFAIVSGVKPEQGLYTSIIAAAIVAVFGGTRVQIAGPTGAFVVILATITAEHGIAGLQIATLMAGIILVFMGLARLGSTIKFIPYPVVVGFTSGIAVIIFVNEWKDFFGLPINIVLDASFYSKVVSLLQALPLLDPITSIISASSLLILILWTRLIKMVPAAIIVLLYATWLQWHFSFSTVATVGTVYGHISRELPHFIVPKIDLSTISSLFNAALLIAFLGAIESLLSATAADSICNTKHNSNKELIGQGLANIISPLFGGFASTGAIARTVANIRNGGNSPIAAIVHSLTLVLILFALAPYAEHIPLAALAAILVMVAYNMSDISEFVHIMRFAPRQDVMILLTTFILTIATNLITGVVVGVILAMLLFMARIHKLTEVKTTRTVAGMPLLPSDCMVCKIQGPFFFGVAEKIEQSLMGMHMDVRSVIFRLNEVSMIDLTGLETFSKIIEQFNKHNVKVYLCEASDRISSKLKRAGITDLVESKRVFDSITDIHF
jgi:SulP family sulfate permease